MGTFERSYLVDGEAFDLYAQLESETVTGYQLVEQDGTSVGEPFAALPDEHTVAAVVREASVA